MARSLPRDGRQFATKVAFGTYTKSELGHKTMAPWEGVALIAVSAAEVGQLLTPPRLRDQPTQRRRERVNFLARVVKRKRGADRRLDAEPVEYGLSAMVARSDRDPLLVQGRTHCDRIVAVEHE